MLTPDGDKSGTGQGLALLARQPLPLFSGVRWHLNPWSFQSIYAVAMLPLPVSVFARHKRTARSRVSTIVSGNADTVHLDTTVASPDHCQP